jgi:hypothetical protein
MKKSVFLVLVGLGVGYVLGARAGRERYDQIVDTVSGVWDDPRVAKARREAARYAREQAPVIVDRAQALGNRAQSAVKSVGKNAVNTAQTKANEVATRAGEAREAMLDTEGDGLAL